MNWRVALNFGRYTALQERIRENKLRGIETYRPCFRQPILRDGRVVYEWIDLFEDELFLDRPRLCRYVFIRCKDKLVPVLPRHVPLSWVQFGDRIATVSDSTVEDLRAWTKKLSRTADARLVGKHFAEANLGRQVYVGGSVLRGYYAQIIGGGSRDRIFVELSFLGQPTRCEVGTSDVELV